MDNVRCFWLPRRAGSHAVYMNRSLLVGVDTGGTFTDFVVFDGKRLRTHKVLSTPDDPARAVLEGLDQLSQNQLGQDQTDPDHATALGRIQRMVIGTTVATNAVLEGKGAKVALVTNRGFADLLTLGRQARPQLYALNPEPPPPPIPRELCWEVDGRLGSEGQTVMPLSDAALEQIDALAEQHAPESVAVVLLFSYLQPEMEVRIGEHLAERCFVSLSSAVLPEEKEYERGMATWLNAAVEPVIQRYVGRLMEGLRDDLASRDVSLMQSAGTTVAAGQAPERAVHLLLSGPAGGLAAARFMGGLLDRRRLMTLDMGGTSTDVSLIDGAIRHTRSGRIGEYPVAVPMVDMHTIGAGGGSIARVDSGGLLLVGPESAGADPGPACYGQGGEQATVTDANVVLGRIPAQTRLGGTLPLDRAAAVKALTQLGKPLSMTVEQVAAGIIRIANEHMAKALRVISLERGHDPADFTLVCFGGAGGLHACELADLLGCHRMLVPARGGVLSALGMLVSEPGRDLSQAVLKPLEGLSDEEIDRGLDRLCDQAVEALAAEGVAACDLRIDPLVELRYQGQSGLIRLPWRGLQAAADDFVTRHQADYGYRLNRSIELANICLQARGLAPVTDLPLWEESGGESPGETRLADLDRTAPVMGCAGLMGSRGESGPLVISDPNATVYVAPGWRVTADQWGNLLLEKG